jgi:signal transduction histidine kinase
MKLKVRLTLWFLAISLIPMVLVIYFSYSMTRRALLVQIFNQLESLANVQQSRVEALLSERKRELLQFADRPQLRSLLNEYSRTPNANSREILTDLLTSIQLDQPRYKEITLLDLRGNVIASTDSGRRARNYADTSWFTLGRMQCEVSVVGHSPRGLALRMAGPLIIDEPGPVPDGNPLSINKRLVGVCLIVTDAEGLVNLVGDRTGLGESGEFFITRREPNGDALVVTPLRDSPDSALHLRVSHLDRASPSVRSLTSEEKGVFEGVDFHGAAVYAATRHISAADWGLVVKIDRDEALKPIHAFRDLVLWAMVALTMLTVLASFSLARSITEPLDSLTHAAQEASEGDLTTRVEVKSEDELGILGRAFNHMASSLETMHSGLETLVAERTGELEAANQRLKELDRLKSEFLATMSHELRTPLNSIMGFSEILVSDDDDRFDAEHREQLRCIYNSARHLLKIIDEILEVSKIEAGRMKVEPQWFSMLDLVRQAADILRPQANHNRLKISLDLPSDDPVLVCTEPNKFLRVLVNLMGNAVKFTPQGGVYVTVRHLEGESSEAASGLFNADRVEISVRDTGIGIPPEEFSNLFQPFKQLDSSTRRQYEGTGLGLYYSRKVVELLGGTITVRSVVGEGTTFTVLLPVRGADAPPRPAELEQAMS